ncbi:invertase inhibitor [Pyrus ussuriensis x Pyrus communis]|uniref:Invertase inhibitor n=1 Tax=Pyrus ussuriensis x Pyrus communis TaxID=2448454 RepID=A0A5N5GGD2_9ROSA|nr:invertase inhibitor [Pyrus ussuriensis x Pyrus communis]
MRTPTFSFTTLPLYLLFFFFSFNAITAKNLIPETCKKFAQYDPNLSYNFCVTSLQAAPKSQRTDLHKLGIISIKLIRNNVTDTRHYIKHLLKNKKLDPYVRACLSDCLELYSDAIPTIKKALMNYKSKKYNAANIEVSSVIDATITCEDGFKQGRLVSPLTKRNNYTFQLSIIALSFINLHNSLN